MTGERTKAASCHGGAGATTAQVEIALRVPVVAVAGNPNTGKTTLFNRLTGNRAKVANYPGITVERLEGRAFLPGVATSVRCVDVPGQYSLSARSREEQIALDCVLGLAGEPRPDVVLVVVDGTQLGRNLYLLLQVIELDVPVVVAVNMTDELERDGRVLDAARMERDLGVPVVPVSALAGTGVEVLRQRLADVIAEPARGRPGWRWIPTDTGFLARVDRVAADVPEAWHGGSDRARRALALWALLSIGEDDELEGVPEALRRTSLRAYAEAEEDGEDLDETVIRGRFSWIDARIDDFVREPGRRRVSVTDRIDRVLLHPLLGFVLFLGLMTIVFQSLFSWSDPAIGLVEDAFGHLGAFLEASLPAGFLRDLLVEGIVAGVGGVLVFLPQIALLFLFIALMEGTGYMARVAFLMDRVMRAVGLHGRAFVPMLSGFACAIPAVMATRTMERRRDRLLTMMVVPLMTCSARLPVYVLMIAALYPPGSGGRFRQGLLMAGMYLFSTVTALVAAFVLGRTVLRGPKVPLILEMPPYRMPRVSAVLRTMWDRSAVFVREAGTVILVCTIGRWFLLSFPRETKLPTELEQRVAALETERAQGSSDETLLEERAARLDAEVESARLKQSYAGRLGHAIEPVIAPLGFDWEIGIGLIGAFAAREVFVSTMAVVYGLDEDQDAESDTLRERIRAQERPDGRPVFTPLVCFSLMVFFALACQCMSTIAVVKRETGTWRWPLFLFGYMSVLAWVASFVVFQGGRLLGFE
ncbi:MAG: ferrous iron transport protein B [Planctomycetota bacterium]